MNELISKITEDLENSEMKTMKVYHSTFSNNREFSKENTFTEYDVEKYGAFHGAIDIEGTDSGRQVAENRMFVKILEDAKQMVGISPVTLSKVLGERDVDFKLLEEETGYKVKGKFLNPVMIEAEVKYTKALELNENRLGRWNPSDIIQEIMTEIENGAEIEGFTEDDLMDYYEDNINLNDVAFVDLISEEYGGEEFNQDYKEFMFVRDWLESKGYDAIKYVNTFEGNSECVMSFRPENVKVTDSYCLKDMLNIEQPKEKVKRKMKP